jgi:hypothetical protein
MLYLINLHFDFTDVFETVSSASWSVAETRRCSLQESPVAAMTLGLLT